MFSFLAIIVFNTLYLTDSRGVYFSDFNSPEIMMWFLAVGVHMIPAASDLSRPSGSSAA